MGKLARTSSSNLQKSKETFPVLWRVFVLPPTPNLATAAVPQVFFSLLSAWTEITPPEKSAQNYILCTSARCQSPHLPLRCKKNTIFSPAGLIDTRSQIAPSLLRQVNLCVKRSQEVEKEIKKKGLCPCPLALEKWIVWMCHFKERWRTDSSSQAGEERNWPSRCGGFREGRRFLSSSVFTDRAKIKNKHTNVSRCKKKFTSTFFVFIDLLCHSESCVI